MKLNPQINVLLAIALTFITANAFAQGGGQGSGQGSRQDQSGARQMDRTQDYERERIRSQEQIDKASQARDQEMARAREQAMERTKQQAMERAKAPESDQMMGRDGRQASDDVDQSRERSRVEDRVGAAGQDREQVRIHQPDLAPMSDQAIYGSQLMSVAERNAYRQEVQNAGSVEQREQLQARHREEMEVRARVQGVPLSDTVEAEEIE